jgi:hypothetical protein
VATRETIQHDPVYEYLHTKTFGKPEDKPALEIYLPQSLRAAGVLQGLLRDVWRAEIGQIWSQIVNQMAAANVRGDFLEFGVFSGGSFRRLLELFSGKGIIGKFWGFDSFQGLPTPIQDMDQHAFRQGQYQTTREQAWAHITRGLPSTDHIELVEGWFTETLPRYAGLRYVVFLGRRAELSGRPAG